VVRGSLSPRVIDRPILTGLLIVIIWDLDTGDSLGASVAQSEKVYSDAVAQNPRNILALNYETYSGTA
jgi:hypothetical protein